MRTPDGLTLYSSCDIGCTYLHTNGEAYEPQGSVVASPYGTTYSVHHQLGGLVYPDDPDPFACLLFFHPNLPGAPDDIVAFDGIEEAIRTDLLYNVPNVIETEIAQPEGRWLIRIDTSSPSEDDLFPEGIEYNGVPLTDACFTIGIDDPLDWEGIDAVVAAEITFFYLDGTSSVPADITSFLSDPWDGFLNVTLPGGAGNDIIGVRLELLVEKALELTNDDCVDRIPVTDGTTPFTTLGATTDGNESEMCRFGGYADIGSDVWFSYDATCTGTLTVDLCGSEFDTKAAVYNGCGRCPPDSEPLGCDDDLACGLQARVAVPVVADDCYTIRVGGYQGLQGEGSMTVTCSVIGPPEGACCGATGCISTLPEVECLSQGGVWYAGETCPEFSCPAAPPANDECNDCIRLLTGEAVNASSDGASGADVSSCGLGDTNDVWYCWTADCTGLATFETCGSAIDTVLAIYDACDGSELGCDDDGCNPAEHTSRVTLGVTEGTTYRIRVSGYAGEVGDYRLLVKNCTNACCAPPGPGVHFGCAMGTAEQCAAAGGVLQPPGSVCLGDGDGNTIDDACEPCPDDATIYGASPADGTFDARQPHARNAALPRQGIGSPGEPGSMRESILVLLIPRIAQAEGCFAVCETDPDPVEGDNFPAEVIDQGNGIYEIVLDHAISAGGITTIEYLGDGSYVEYTAHPVNSDAGLKANAYDILELIECCLEGDCLPLWGAYSCDIDRSTQISPLDILTAVDILNGAEAWESWDGTYRPANEVCPP